MSLILTGNSSNITIDSTSGITFPNSTTQASAGAVLQVVYGSLNTQVTITATSYSNIGLTATITPKFSTSKVLAMCTINIGKGVANTGGGIQLLRSGTIVYAPSQVDATGPYNFYSDNANYWGMFPLNYIDSPATTSAITYYVQSRAYNGTGGLVFNGSASGLTTVGTSNIILMEVAA